MLEKTYQPAAIEPRVRDDWDKADAFKAGRPDRATAELRRYRRLLAENLGLDPGPTLTALERRILPVVRYRMRMVGPCWSAGFWGLSG